MFLKSNLAQVIRIFFSCAEEDVAYASALKMRLGSLTRNGLVQCYNKYEIEPGVEWEKQAKEYLHASNIVLLLVSPFFVASDYCYEEAELAMALHNNGNTRVIPIIVRPTDEWERLVFGKLASLPIGEAVSMRPNPEEAFSNIVRGIKEAIVDLKSKVRISGMDKPLPLWNVPYWRNLFFTGRYYVRMTNLNTSMDF
jgi:hypothetical protein